MNLTTISQNHAVDDLRRLAFTGLRRMFRPHALRFAFRLRRSADDRDQLEGVSDRYTAMVLIGLAGEVPDAGREILAGAAPYTVCEDLAAAAPNFANLGDLALTLWASCEWALPARESLREKLESFDFVAGAHPTVELAWTLDALVADGGADPLTAALARRLMRSLRPEAGLFPHWPVEAMKRSARAHVACFADQVYPTHALSRYGVLTGDREAVVAARRCAEKMCDLQGRDGQWWWHFDVRTGRVLEGYPVYAVHQDAMAPMALFAAQRACGVDFSPAIHRGLAWLRHAPEIGGSLIDPDAGVIWRKVARREPAKLSRSLQAAASRLHSGVRVMGLNLLFPPAAIDRETRPYHLGWLLYAWPESRTGRDHSKGKGASHVRSIRPVADPAPV